MMSKQLKSLKKGRMAGLERDYILNHMSTKTVKDIAKYLKRTVGFVQKVVDKHQAVVDVVESSEPKKVSAKEKKNQLFGDKKGVSISTPAASEQADEFVQANPARAKDTTGFIHKMFEG